jgi:hypothetical protein
VAQTAGTEPIRVRVVVQGGGAKLVVLMAAMEAVETWRPCPIRAST